MTKKENTQDAISGWVSTNARSKSNLNMTIDQYAFNIASEPV